MYEVLHLSRKIIFPKLKIWCSKMQPLSGNQRPDLLTSLINMSLVLRLPRKMHLCRSSSNVPRLPSFLEMLQNPHVCSLLTRCTIPCCGAFNILTSKCASRHNGVHFFDILTSKSVPKLRCFVHFHLEMCFAPQRRAIFHFSSGSAPVALASLLFDPPEPQIIGKTQCFATFLPFRAPAFSFFGVFLFLIFFLLLTLPISAFHLSILSEVWLLNFLRLIT